MATHATRIDAFPENLLYQDTGCQLHPSCLSCPLAVCVEDLDRAGRRARQAAKAARALALRKAGLTYLQIAAAIPCSLRQVHRLIRSAQLEPLPELTPYAAHQPRRRAPRS